MHVLQREKSEKRMKTNFLAPLIHPQQLQITAKGPIIVGGVVEIRHAENQSRKEIMNLLQEMEGLKTRFKVVEGQLQKLIAEYSRDKGTGKDNAAELVSGSYAAAMVIEPAPEHEAVKVKLFVSNRRVVIDQFYSMEDFKKIFMQDRKDFELFVRVLNLNIFNPEVVKTIKFEIKVSKGTQAAHMPVIKDVHAVGVWQPNEFIDLFAQAEGGL